MTSRGLLKINHTAHLIQILALYLKYIDLKSKVRMNLKIYYLAYCNCAGFLSNCPSSVSLSLVTIKKPLPDSSSS